MKNLTNKNLIPVAILVSAILISSTIVLRFNMDILQNIFSIVGSLSIAVALSAYLYKKRQDERLATIEQITFFRERIIPKWDKVSKMIMNKNNDYWFSRIRLDKLSIADVRKDYSINFDNQLSAFFDSSSKESGKWIDTDVLDQQAYLLNLIEEFSLKVNHFKTPDHAALHSLHAVFVELVEKNAVALLFIREVIVDNPIYSSTLSLYSFWKDRVKKPNILKNLEKGGFITKKQKEEIYRIRRENSIKQ